MIISEHSTNLTRPFYIATNRNAAGYRIPNNYIILYKLTDLACHVCLTDVIRLERSLRSFACLTKGDTIAIPYNKKVQVSNYSM